MKTVSDVLIEEIGKHRQDYLDLLEQGRAKDYAHYKYVTGVLTGLALVSRTLSEIQRQLEESDSEN